MFDERTGSQILNGFSVMCLMSVLACILAHVFVIRTGTLNRQPRVLTLATFDIFSRSKTCYSVSHGENSVTGKISCHTNILIGCSHLLSLYVKY